MVDYSKWKNIEISDDEDDTHPNIDTPSLFRWRHQARVERMEEFEREQLEVKKEFDKIHATLKEKESQMKSGNGDVTALEKSIEELKVKENSLMQKQNEILIKEKKAPWNVDTISKPGFTKTVINKLPERKNDDGLTEEERAESVKVFVKANEKLLKQYGMLRKFDDSKEFLMKNTQLVCENTANYLVIWCINLEIEDKKELMGHVAHQCICMQYILELSKTLEVDPRACVSSFFARIQVAEKDYKDQFYSEIDAFILRIQKRAAEKIEEAVEEERKARLGPGGLDPYDVFEKLPKELQHCFEARDIPLLHQTLAKLPIKQAKQYMKQCVDSGLWVPDDESQFKYGNNDDDEDDDGDDEEDENAAAQIEEIDEKSVGTASIDDDIGDGGKSLKSTAGGKPSTGSDPVKGATKNKTKIVEDVD